MGAKNLGKKKRKETGARTKPRRS
jgi:hypothetical protein